MAFGSSRPRTGGNDSDLFDGGCHMYTIDGLYLTTDAFVHFLISEVSVLVQDDDEDF